MLDKITIHGYLSQAYAISDGNHVVGIPEKGTTDYRTAALQMRVQISPKDIFAVQISHERIGKSRVQTVHDDLELDWMFYEHRFGNSAVKVGRLPIPFGIYNELRDVGGTARRTASSPIFWSTASSSTSRSRSR